MRLHVYVLYVLEPEFYQIIITTLFFWWKGETIEMTKSEFYT